MFTHFPISYIMLYNISFLSYYIILYYNVYIFKLLKTIVKT